MTIVMPSEAGYWLDEYDSERFWARVNLHGGTEYTSDPLATATGECWLWTGAVNGHGYGWFKVFEHVVLPHRVSYMDFGNKLPADLQIDHLCRTKTCVRPSHLEAVTHRTNVQRGIIGNRTHCKHGHEYTEANTRIEKRPSGDVRICRECRKASRR